MVGNEETLACHIGSSPASSGEPFCPSVGTMLQYCFRVTSALKVALPPEEV